jgi:predicted DNA-binding transcriptional regulator AlpA
MQSINEIEKGQSAAGSDIAGSLTPKSRYRKRRGTLSDVGKIEDKATDPPSFEIVREPERRRMTGLSRVQWWRLERSGKVPRKVQLGENSVGWLRSELEGWLAKRIAERDANAPKTA